MLFNPKWNRQKSTISRFVDWLGTKDPDESYDWYDGANCAVAQYRQETGDRPEMLMDIHLHRFAGRVSTFGELRRLLGVCQ